MKALNLILALAAPAFFTAANLPDNYNSFAASDIQLVRNVAGDDDEFQLCKQPYYEQLFSKKELKKLKKAEKYRQQSKEALVLASAFQKQADELRSSSPEITSKIQEQIAKLEAKAAQQELDGLKTYEKAVDIYSVVYTNVLNNRTFAGTEPSEKTAQKLASDAYINYQSADMRKQLITSENAQEGYRAVYALSNKAVHDQEIALAIIHGDKTIDYTKYQANRNPEDGNIPKESIPQLVAKEHYDFDKDTNIYKIRYHLFEERLKVSDDDKKIVSKMEGNIANSITLFQKAEKLGCTADTFRVYSGESTTLAEREYYEQKAQECELNECSNLVKAVKLEVESNNALLDLYQKYVPKIRNANDTLGKSYEDQANDLYNLSKTYEALAAKQYSHVEQYTQLKEGNEVKLQAIECMENAIASYLGDSVNAEGKMSLATGASDKHNDIAMDFVMDESDGAAPSVSGSATPKNNSSKPAANNANQVVDAKPSQNGGSKPANTLVEKPQQQQKQQTASNTSSKPASQQQQQTVAQSNTAATRTPAMQQSQAAVVSTSYYTKNDQRMKPYVYPKGTVFSVEAGIYKEMPEPVEFPSVDKFLAQNLKGVTPMRYYIGEFKTYDAAYATLAQAKDNGYRNAKVVAFVNGKLSDAATARKAAEKTAGYQDLVQQELKKINATQRATTPVVAQADSKSGAALPLQQLSGEQYAVQISSVPTLLDAKAFNVSELFYDRNDGGLYRYYTGVSNDVNIANTNLQTMRQAGYQDAYLVRVVDGKNMGAVSKSNGNAPQASYPVYRVQIGAYKAELTPASKAQINKLKQAGYTIHTSQSGQYTVYCVGDCGSRSEAEKLRDALRAKGCDGAYVVTFVNGVKQ